MSWHTIADESGYVVRALYARVRTTEAPHVIPPPKGDWSCWSGQDSTTNKNQTDWVVRLMNLPPDDVAGKDILRKIDVNN